MLKTMAKRDINSSFNGLDDQEGDQKRLCLSARVGQDPQIRIEFTIGTFLKEEVKKKVLL